MRYNDGLSANLRAALLALHAGRMNYTVAGFQHPDSLARHFGTKTLTALEQRGFATVVGRGMKRYAAITDDGRPIAAEILKRAGRGDA